MIFDTDIPQIPPNAQTCKRAKLDIGTFCNYKCYFCYYKNSLHIKNSLGEVLQRISTLKRLGCCDFDLSGGEPTVCAEFFDILKVLEGNKISCVSNGYNFAKFDFIAKAKDYGLSEILLSLHSGDEQTHDYMVGHKRAYKRLVKAIENANKLGIEVRINSTITADNADLKGFKETISNFNISQINFLPVNNFAQTQQNPNVRLDAIIQYTENSHIEVNVRYIPFCLAPSIADNIKNYYQHIFDLKDWNIAWYEYLPDTWENLNAIIKQNRKAYYFKEPKCLSCKFFNICDGFKKH